MSKLPIGIQSFEKLRRGGYVYIDKTMHIVQLLEGGMEYFLSRPRRFGKSLFVTTLEAYFRGQKDLFEGLAIEKEEARKPEKEQWIEYPVMKFSLSGGSFGTNEGLEQVLAYNLRRFEEEYHLPHFKVQSPGQDETSVQDAKGLRAILPVWLTYCLEKGAEATGRQIVFLVDEYDKPLLENLSVNPEQEERNREMLKSFFSILKDEDKYLKFAFFTGVTKFSKVSIFSDLNQLEDISLNQEMSDICGITETEMEENMEDDIRKLAAKNNMSFGECLSELAQMYDGYHFSFDGAGVYNPFSLFNALRQGRFSSFWFSTGTPTFLIRKLSASRFKPVDFYNGVRTTEKAIEDYRTDNPDPVPLFYQAGYLTITGYDRRFKQYILAFPNQEVRNGFVDSIFPYYFNQEASEGVFELDRFIYDLDHGDVDSFMTRLKSLFASVNYPEGAAPYSEHDFQSNIFIVFCMLGEVVRTEVHTSKGRTDCEVEDGDLIYLFEFKVDRTAEEAFSQIEDRQYALRYAASGKTIIKVGINFSTQDRTVQNWKAEKVSFDS